MQQIDVVFDNGLDAGPENLHRRIPPIVQHG